MSELDKFALRVNLNGWNIRKYGTFHAGQEIEGKDICPRMVQALKDKETFMLHGLTETPVCILRGGTVEELEAAMQKANSTPAVKKPVSVPTPPAPKAEKVSEPVVEDSLEDEEDDLDDSSSVDSDVVRKPKKKKSSKK